MISPQIPKSSGCSGDPGPGDTTTAATPWPSISSRQRRSVFGMTSGSQAVSFPTSWHRLNVNESLLSTISTRMESNWQPPLWGLSEACQPF